MVEVEVEKRKMQLMSLVAQEFARLSIQLSGRVPVRLSAGVPSYRLQPCLFSLTLILL